VSDDWSDGYVTDFDYTWGFFRELAPSWLSWIAGLHGFRVRAPGEPFNYIELGCGNGLSTNALAAAYPEGNFWACDFNPNHIANASELAERAGTRNIHFLEKSFAELESAGLPDFDFVTFHGVLSWISPENRKQIIQFLRNRLKPGGICYVSYNALPGWSSLEPVRRMMLEYAATIPGDTSTKVRAAVAWLERLRDLNAKPIAENARVQRLVERIVKADPAYVAHEYFNKDWELFYFQDVVREFGAAKLSWAGSGNLVDNEDGLRIPRAGADLLRTIGDPLVREQNRDFLQSPTFRKDLFVKGTPRADWAKDPLANPGLLQLPVGNARASTKLAADVKTPAGTVRFKNDFDPLFYRLFDRASLRVGDVLEPMRGAGRSPQQTLGSLRVFVAADQLRPFARVAATPALTGRFQGLSGFNRVAVDEAIDLGKTLVLSSTSHGNGVLFTAREACILDGLTTVGQHGAVDRAWARLKAAGRRLVIDGKTITGEAEHRASLAEELQLFERRKIDRYLRLGILEVL
jgi:SAM-dependent methyltransferase